MAAAKKTQVIITANAATAKKVMDELQQRVEQIKAKMQTLDVTTKQGQKDLKALQKELVSYNSAVVQNISNTERIKNAMDNLSKTSLNELKRALSAAKTELGKMSSSSARLKEMQGNVKALQDQIDKLTGSTKRQGGAWQTAMKNLTAYVGMFAVFNKAKDLITGVVKKNLEYSASLTDIRKVSGLAMEEVNQLSRELAKIDTRTSMEGLAKLAYEGAKLGMEKYGVEGMAGFVRAADQINVAIGEEMGEQALPALSKMVEVMGLIPKMGIEKAMLATGSAMFRLASSSTSASGNIVEFAKRCTGVARTAGITIDQLLALGSAFDAQMASPEVAATAMSKFIVAMQKNHNLIEKNLGIPDGTINSYYSAGRAIDAIVLILEKMRDKGNMNALGDVFKDVGGDGQRLISSMVTMAKNVDMLKDHLYESQEAFEEATAVTNEYKMQQTSALGILERANNLWEKAFVNPEGVESVKSMTQAWYDISQTILQSPLYNNTLQFSLSAILFILKGIIYALPALINLMISAGVVKGIQYIRETVVAIRAAATAQAAFNTTVLKNPYVLAATALFTFIGVISSFVSAANDAAEAQEEVNRRANEWRKTLDEAAVSTQAELRKLNEYKTILSQANMTQEERRKVLARFNKDFRPYLSNLGIEITKASDLTAQYSKLAKEIRQANYYRMREKALQEVNETNDRDVMSAENSLKSSLSQLGIKGYTGKDIMSMLKRGTNVNTIFEQLAHSAMGAYAGGNKHYKGGYTETIEKDGSGRYTGNLRVRAKQGAYSSTPHSIDATQLWSSLRWLNNSLARQRTGTKKVMDAYADFIEPGYTPWVAETPGTLDKEAADKEAAAEAERQRNEQKQAWSKELKQAQDDAKAVMDNLSNFYDRQINEKLARAVALNMNDNEQSIYTADLRQSKQAAMAQARLAISGQPNTWEATKENLRNEMLEKPDETGVNLSENLLSQILGVDIEALRKKMLGLEKNLGKPFNSSTAEIFANATKNEKNMLSLEAKQQEERRKAALENDYLGAVQSKMYDVFQTNGYANLTEEDFAVNRATLMPQNPGMTGEEADKALFEARKLEIIDMYEKARKEIATLYSIDPSTKSGQGLLMKFLFGDDASGLGSRIASTLGDSAADWQVFYAKLIQYSDEYTEAQKKTYEQAKKVADQMWAINQRNLAQQRELTRMQNESSMFGKRTNFLSNLGLADPTADPEVEIMRLRMQMAEDYYAFVLKNSQNQQLISEAEKSRQEAELAYADQMAKSMKDRLAQMKSLVAPIEEFGTSVGEAFAQMGSDAESANKAIKNALKSMLQQWGRMALNSVSTQMWKAINDAGAKKGTGDAQAGIDQARKNADASTPSADLSTLGTAGNPMHVLVDNAQGAGTNGNPSAVNANGAGGASANGTSEAPSAWLKRNPGKTMADYNREVGSAVGGAAGEAAGGGVGGSIVSAAVSSGTNALSDALTSKKRKKELAEEKKHQKALTKEKKKGVDDQTKETKKGMNEMTSVTEEGNAQQQTSSETTNEAISTITETTNDTLLSEKQENNQEVAKSDSERAQAETTFSMVGALAKCYELLGPIAGPIAAAVVKATLNGLLQWALTSIFGGGSKSSSSASTNTKLKSGMLTYDSGNVQDLKPFVGDNGEVYWASENSIPGNGARLLTTPTATTINGYPSLVAENGPELVIGRETTKAMMMNNPSLLKALVNYDANYSGRRTYDNGNLSDVGGAAASSALSSASSAALADATASNVALMQAVNALLERLNTPINAKIDMYGTGNLYESISKANQFMKGKRS